MLFQITEIEFDFDSDDEYVWNTNEQQKLIDETIGQIWEAEDGDDLVDQITESTGWCIKSIDYFVPQIY